MHLKFSTIKQSNTVLAFLLVFTFNFIHAQTIQYTVSFPEAGLHRMHVELEAKIGMEKTLH